VVAGEIHFEEDDKDAPLVFDDDGTQIAGYYRSVQRIWQHVRLHFGRYASNLAQDCRC
jgi:hypothetical protein